MGVAQRRQLAGTYPAQQGNCPDATIKVLSERDRQHIVNTVHSVHPSASPLSVAPELVPPIGLPLYLYRIALSHITRRKRDAFVGSEQMAL
jgi:hypothetical protein